jgi:putative phosphoserine phosphatase/1-acylglycerol-3-phosphate O-acyltransferase
MWRNSFWLRPGRIDVRVLPPIPTRDWRAGTVGEHAAEVRELFVRTLAEW